MATIRVRTWFFPQCQVTITTISDTKISTSTTFEIAVSIVLPSDSGKLIFSASWRWSTLLKCSLIIKLMCGAKQWRIHEPLWIIFSHPLQIIVLWVESMWWESCFLLFKTFPHSWQGKTSCLWTLKKCFFNDLLSG